LVPRQSIHERDDLQIEFIQRHIEIDHERIERVVVIRDPDIQVPFCGCATLDPVRREIGCEDGPLTASTHFFRRILARALVTTLLDMRAWRKSRWTSSADPMITEVISREARRDSATHRVALIT